MKRAILSDYLIHIAGNPDEHDRFLNDPVFARASLRDAGVSPADQRAMLSGEFLEINRAIATELRALAHAGRGIAGLTLSNKPELHVHAHVEVQVETQVEVQVETHMEAHVEVHVQTGLGATELGAT